MFEMRFEIRGEWYGDKGLEANEKRFDKKNSETENRIFVVIYFA